MLAAGVVAWRSGDDDGPATGSADEPATTTAEVTVRDLEERTELDGTLGYGDTSQLALSAQGTVTWLPPEGSVVDRGQAVAEVDDRVVPLLFGDRPLWRELGSGVEDGPDVELVEANLVALGVVTADELTVDQEWTSATTDALEEWQEALGLEETGRLAPGAVAVQPGAVRVAAHVAELGGQAGGPDPRGGRHDPPGHRRPRGHPPGHGRRRPDRRRRAARRHGRPRHGGGGRDGGRDPRGVRERPDGRHDAHDRGHRLAGRPGRGRGARPGAGHGQRGDQCRRRASPRCPSTPCWPWPRAATPSSARWPAAAPSWSPVEIGAFADGWVQVTGDLAEGDDVVVPE